MAAVFDGPILSRPAVQMGKYHYGQEEICNYILEHFESNLRGYSADSEKAVRQARNIAIRNMHISGRYFCRPLEALRTPLSPQQQADLCVSIGLPMIVAAVEQAVANAGITTKDVSALIYTSHSPFPFPPLSTHVINSLEFKQDCVNMPCLSMGCAGGGYALRTARDYLSAHPDHAALIINCELCSLGFRPHKSGMSWFLNTSLFGDAVAATVVRGSAFDGGKGDGMQIVHGKQRQVKNTTDVSYFTYDECGYHFITTQLLCEVAARHCPSFARDLAQESFGKEPKDLALNVIHPGGARMIEDIGRQLELIDSPSDALAWRSMRKLGNVASATITDMIDMAWDDLRVGDHAIVVGMGPGFVLDGVSLRMVSESDVDALREKPTQLETRRAKSTWSLLGVIRDVFATAQQLRYMV